MNAKSITTIFLLLFVAGSVAYLIVDESNQPTGVEATDDFSGVPHKVLAYFFHGNTRCDTCEKMEAYAKEALQDGFPEDMKSGRLEWRVANYEEAKYEQLALEHNVMASTVVLVEYRDGKKTQGKNLGDKVWDLVFKEKEGFVSYIREEAKQLLGASDG